MKARFSLASRIALFTAILLATAGGWARAAVTMQLDRNEIHQGETAQLTVNASDNGSDAITPPAVPGLEFTAVDQSSQIEIVNGATTATSSVTYAVTPQAPGTYTIPTQDGTKGLTLDVLPGGAPNAPTTSPNPFSSLPPPAPNQATDDATANPPESDETPFLRMDLPKRPLYVGETVPVTIQMGFPAGSQPTLNGLPALTADAFTLDKLSDKPEQAQGEINGQPYLIITWHSALAAIKPGNFSLGLTAPVTIQERVAAAPQAGEGSDDDSIFGAFFKDPFFRNAMGRVVQKDLNLTDSARTVRVLPLPANGQPAIFSGAVGKFEISSNLVPSTGAAGDPLTLQMKIKGTGSFDRVSTSMLSDVAGWKTYPPTVKFTPSDSAGYRGEKDFEQAVIAEHPGRQSLPPLSFSFFNPDTRQYETLSTTPLVADISPGTAPLAPTTGVSSVPVAAVTPPIAPSDGLRPDEAETGGGLRTLEPLYFQPGFLAGQGALLLGFLGAGIWLRRRDQLAADHDQLKRRRELRAVNGFLSQMDAAAEQRDAATFFLSARQALQHCLGWRWNITPAAVTRAEIEQHLNGKGENVRRVFDLADQLAYSGGEGIEADFSAWKQTVHQLVKQVEKL